MAHAVGWLDADPCQGSGSTGVDSCPDPSAYGTGWLSGGEPWDAGGLFGKTGARGGLWNNFKVRTCVCLCVCVYVCVCVCVCVFHLGNHCEGHHPTNDSLQHSFQRVRSCDMDILGAVHQ